MRGWQPDRIDAERMGKAMEKMEHLFGLDAEVNCGQCSGTHQPGEAHCGECLSHHKPDDAEACQRFQRIERERADANRKAWAESRRLTRRRRRAA